MIPRNIISLTFLITVAAELLSRKANSKEKYQEAKTATKHICLLLLVCHFAE